MLFAISVITVANIFVVWISMLNYIRNRTIFVSLKELILMIWKREDLNNITKTE